MIETIYYFKKESGVVCFSNGKITKDEIKFGQYIRMLRYAKYNLVPLYLDNPHDYSEICKIFNINPNTKWQDIYYEK